MQDNNNNLDSSSLDNNSLNNNNLDLLCVLILSFCLLVVSALTGTFMAYPLLVSLCLFITVLCRRGFSLWSLLQMAWAGAQQSRPVVEVLLLIGIITAVWMAAGTVPALVYYGTELISPRFFILWAFLLTSMVSVLTGTSFGATGTIGIALMVIARGNLSDAVLNPVAGAIIAGAFVGDRCSPMSSSAHLVASITHTSLYTNLRNMVASGLWPLLLSVAFYSVLSLAYPIQPGETTVTNSLPVFFSLEPVVLAPAGSLLLLACLRVNVRLAMLASLGMGLAIAHTIQGYSLPTLFQFTLLGFQLSEPTPLQSILLGGGLLPMAKATLVVLISTAFSGIFSGSHTLRFIDTWLHTIRNPNQLKKATVAVSTVSNLFGCTQTIGILLTSQIMQSHYLSLATKAADTPPGNEQLALALEDTAVVIAPLIPWNIAGLIPATVLSVGPGFIPYAAYLFLLPLFFTFKSHLQISANVLNKANR
ncbi:MAG: Na+/H+ antiporter NhaC family protein [Cyanobacteria bacterium J06627_32]